MKKMICPHCGGNEFITTAHVAQDWRVDECGNFIELIQDCTDVIVAPDPGNIWTCSRCGTEAVCLNK